MSNSVFILTGGNLTFDPTLPQFCTDGPFICFGPKVPVPVPVPTPTFSGGGGGIWPWWRVKKEERERQKCLAENYLKLFSKDKDKGGKISGIPLGKGHEKLLKKPRTELDKLREELGRTKGKLVAVNKELRERRDKDRLYGERDIHLQEENEALRVLVEKLTQQVKAIWKKVKRRGAGTPFPISLAGPPKIEVVKEAPKPQPAPVVVAVPALAPVPEVLPVAEEVVDPFAAERERGARIAESIMDATPWALSSAVVFAGTWYLVPPERKVFKFIGYTGAGILAAAAVIKAARGFLPVMESETGIVNAEKV